MAGVGFASIAGCLTAGDSTEGTIRISLASEPTDGDWGEYGGVVPYYTPFHETLTASPPDLQSVEPRLATGWEVVDETTWHFTIRDDVTLHDGSELTASLAGDALSAILEARPIGFTRLTPDSFTAVDEYVLEIETTQPEPATPGNLAHPLLSIQHPDADDPVGTGPYAAESVTSGEPVEAVGFDDYWRAVPETQLIFEGVSDPQTRSLRLESGETDVALDLPRGSYGELARNDDLKIRTETEPRTGMVMVNRYREVTSDPDLRKALQYAVDQRELVEEVLDGIGEPARSPFSNVIPWSAHDELPEYTDMDQARALLETSEYDGEELRFIIDGNQSEQQLIAQEMQRRYNEIGIEIAIEQVESAAFFGEYTGGEADLAFVELGSINGAADYLVYVMYHSEGGDNVGQYESEGTGVVNPGEEVDELIEQGDTAFDEDVKHEAYREVQQRVMDDGVTIPVYYKDYVIGTDADVDGPDLHAIPHMTDWTTLSK
ncbi:ABC transporter substrate-binding protein [Natronocalculus amylovorans]|uniref:ABC transporter substrate-binding protein n=1 Tax=Natronocalculus amylovorans TaxID=2917812 RepID=A0AAE3FYN1_9EURY|nr:ABC transporter substrate-binding protein [Natronocalculus amylovorans]MCL9817734.1 ABC transporter substrate-binding protein [Natronocalculus amylovorans]